MTGDQSEQVIMGSAIVVAGVFAYTAWQGDEKLSLGEFATAWGVIYLVLALIADMTPGLAAAFSILVMVSMFLDNLPSLGRLLSGNETKTTAPSATSTVQSTLAPGTHKTQG